jgi:hypothetical protein
VPWRCKTHSTTASTRSCTSSGARWLRLFPALPGCERVAARWPFARAPRPGRMRARIHCAERPSTAPRVHFYASSLLIPDLPAWVPHARPTPRSHPGIAGNSLRLAYQEGTSPTYRTQQEKGDTGALCPIERDHPFFISLPLPLHTLAFLPKKSLPPDPHSELL